MKKLSAILGLVTAAVLLVAAPAAAAAGTANTGTYGPADEPTWVIPFVAAFVLFGIVAAIMVARRRGDDASR